MMMMMMMMMMTLVFVGEESALDVEAHELEVFFCV